MALGWLRRNISPVFKTIVLKTQRILPLKFVWKGSNMVTSSQNNIDWYRKFDSVPRENLEKDYYIWGSKFAFFFSSLVCEHFAYESHPKDNPIAKIIDAEVIHILIFNEMVRILSVYCILFWLFIYIRSLYLIIRILSTLPSGRVSHDSIPHFTAKLTLIISN
jgi:hypothetical protein